MNMSNKLSKTLTLFLAILVLKIPAGAYETLKEGDGIRPLVGISYWINSSPITASDLKNKVVIVDFYTSQCSNCMAAVPHVVNLYNKYHERSLIVIGIHTPELPSERQRQVIESTAQRLGITYPIAVDNENKTWSEYNNHYWPNLLIFDRSGQLVFQHAGEGAYEEIDAKVAALL
jgi:thiol-disulfide isomerase/thioredoxin